VEIDWQWQWKKKDKRIEEGGVILEMSRYEENKGEKEKGKENTKLSPHIAVCLVLYPVKLI